MAKSMRHIMRHGLETKKARPPQGFHLGMTGPVSVEQSLLLTDELLDEQNLLLILGDVGVNCRHRLAVPIEDFPLQADLKGADVALILGHVAPSIFDQALGHDRCETLVHDALRMPGLAPGGLGSECPTC